MKKVILASTSPRRKKILEKTNLVFEIASPKYEEDMEALDDPYELVQFLALQKGLSLRDEYDDAIIISADTFIVQDGAFLGKPHTEDVARKMLQGLSGQTHSVVTGFALLDTGSDKRLVNYSEVQVTFRDILADEIEEYVATGEPLDRAGAYAIQDGAKDFVEKIEGDYLGLVGLPLGKLVHHLTKMFGVDARIVDESLEV